MSANINIGVAIILAVVTAIKFKYWLKLKKDDRFFFVLTYFTTVNLNFDDSVEWGKEIEFTELNKILNTIFWFIATLFFLITAFNWY